MPVFDFTSPEGKTYSIEGPEGATQQQAFQMLQQHLGTKQDSPDIGADVAKSAGAGLANAAAGTIGFIGDLRDLRNKIAGSAADKLGIPQSAQSAISAGLGYLPTEALIRRAPTSQDVLSSAPDPIVDPAYKPQTVAGDYTKTTAEFLPGLAAGGPRGILPKLATNVLAPAIAGETAGQLTKGTDLEPYARVAGSLLGGAGATKVANSLAEANAIRAASPSLSEVKKDASSAYDAITSRNVATPLPQASLDNLANDITTTLNNKGIRPSNADSVHRAVAEIKTPATAGAADVADLIAARQSIKELLGKHDTNKTGAVLALNKIEAAIEQNSPGTMARIKEADKNWAAMRANEALDKRVAKAELQASGEHSGQNVGNKIRQQVTGFLNSGEARYLDAATKADLEKIVRGTRTQNAVRQLANLLGGGGGLGMLAGGAAGYEAGGLPGAIAGAAVGRGAKMLNNRSVIKQAGEVARNIRMRSPLGQQTPVSLPAPSNVSLAALRSALLARQ